MNAKGVGNSQKSARGDTCRTRLVPMKLSSSYAYTSGHVFLGMTLVATQIFDPLANLSIDGGWRPDRSRQFQRGGRILVADRRRGIEAAAVLRTIQIRKPLLRLDKKIEALWLSNSDHQTKMRQKI